MVLLAPAPKGGAGLKEGVVRRQPSADEGWKVADLKRSSRAENEQNLREHKPGNCSATETQRARRWI